MLSRLSTQTFRYNSFCIFFDVASSNGVVAGQASAVKNTTQSRKDELNKRLQDLKNSVVAPKATESLYSLRQFDMIIKKVQSLSENDSVWESIIPRILELVALHDGLNQTHNWSDFGVTKKADILLILHKLRDKIYGENGVKENV